MANGYSESDDKNRFIDAKTNGKRNKMNGNKVAIRGYCRFKKQLKHVRHYTQRIVSIAEVFE